MAIIAITTSNSIKVNAFLLVFSRLVHPLMSGWGEMVKLQLREKSIKNICFLYYLDSLFEFSQKIRTGYVLPNDYEKEKLD